MSEWHQILRHFLRPFDKLHAIYFLSNHHKVWWFNTYTTNTTITTFCGDFSTFLWWFQYFLMYELQNDLTHFLDIFCIIQLMSFKLRIWNIYVKLGIMIWLVLQTVSGTTKVWYFYVSTTSTTNVVQVWYQKGAPFVFWIFLYYAPNLTFDDL